MPSGPRSFIMRSHNTSPVRNHSYISTEKEEEEEEEEKEKEEEDDDDNGLSTAAVDVAFKEIQPSTHARTRDNRAS